MAYSYTQPVPLRRSWLGRSLSVTIAVFLASCLIILFLRSAALASHHKSGQNFPFNYPSFPTSRAGHQPPPPLSSSATNVPEAVYVLPSTPDPFPVEADGKYALEAQGVRAQFIPYGASITNLYVRAASGQLLDIVLGFDNATHYQVDKFHPHLGGVPGRYANRIKNGSFTLDDGTTTTTTYHVPTNENNGANTLHGGPNGWDYRDFEVVEYTRTSITFKLVDPDVRAQDGLGFPGEVTAYVEYRVSPYQWHVYMNATSPQLLTPVMLTSHTYWNLDGFSNPHTTTALDHSLALPLSKRRIAVDGTLVPTGDILSNEPGSVNDFWSRTKHVRASLEEDEQQLLGNCGTGCSGYDNCFLVDRKRGGNEALSTGDDDGEGRVGGSRRGTRVTRRRDQEWWKEDAVVVMSSAWSGIEMQVYSDQDAFQLYSCNGQNGTLPIKSSQGFFDKPDRPRTVPKHGCLVVEVQDWIDGINHPSWGRMSKQTVGPKTAPYELRAMHSFQVKHGGTKHEERGKTD